MSSCGDWSDSSSSGCSDCSSRSHSRHHKHHNHKRHHDHKRDKHHKSHGNSGNGGDPQVTYTLTVPPASSLELTGDALVRVNQTGAGPFHLRITKKFSITSLMDGTTGAGLDMTPSLTDTFPALVGQTFPVKMTLPDDSTSIGTLIFLGFGETVIALFAYPIVLNNGQTIAIPAQNLR